MLTSAPNATLNATLPLPKEAAFAPRDERSSARHAFETLLLAAALKPLAESLGFYGDFLVQACAESVLRNPRGQVS